MRTFSAKVRRLAERQAGRVSTAQLTALRVESVVIARWVGAGYLAETNVWIAGVLVDAVWRERRLVVELDGRDNHSSWAQIQDDRSKELRVRAAGFDVIRYGTRQLAEEAPAVEAELRRAHGLPA